VVKAVATALLVLIGAALAVAGALAIVGQAASGAQPWDSELSDNMVFAKAIPFALGLGVAVGLFVPWGWIGRGILAVGFVFAVPTGVWQYLGGILSQAQPVPAGKILLDAAAPVPLYVFYRLHYVGGALILFSVAAYSASWWARSARRIWTPRGWRLGGLFRELPRAIRAAVARRYRLDGQPAAAGSAEFAYYEKIESFPYWESAIGLITITGLVKALRYVFPVPGPVLFVASTLHVAAMVAILILLLDRMRSIIANARRGPRVVLALLVLLWAAGNLVLSYFFVISAFGAHTATKEGLPAQAALLLGGVIVAILAAILAWQSVRAIGGRAAAG